MSERRIHRLAATTLWATVFLIAFGGFTRGSGSGFGCADRWPLCENGLLGGLLPRADVNMIIEWTHRWLAAVVGVLAVATLVVVWRAGLDRRRVGLPAAAAVVAIGIQAWLGRLVVANELAADLVMVHLATSMIVVGLLTVVAVNTWPLLVAPTPRDRTWRLLVGGGAVAVYALVLLGSFVHDLFFAGWPIMQAGIVPSFTDPRIFAHWFHRLLALVLALYLTWLVVVAERRGRSRPERLILVGALAAHLAAVVFGALNVFTKVSSSGVIATHLGLAAVTWVALVAAWLLAVRLQALASLPDR